VPLLITADDAGASIEVNDAIRQSCVNGHVNSVAFLVNLPDFSDAVERVAPCVPHHSVHLNLVEGRPLALTSESPLVDESGWFRYQGSQLLLAYYRSSRATRARMASDIRTEMAAQLTAFAELFPGEVAVDSHQHTHMFPFVLPQVLAAAGDLDVTVSRLRWPVERIGLRSALTSGGAKAMALSAMAIRGRRHLIDSPVQAHTHAFCGVVHTGHMTLPIAQAFLTQVSGLPAAELAELLLHPGGGDHVTPAWERSTALREFYTSPWRGRELRLAQDPALAVPPD
jgi:chitin disaccharide deacetylase